MSTSSFVASRRCCGFLRSDVRVRADAVHLTITAPPEARRAADDLLFARRLLAIIDDGGLRSSLWNASAAVVKEREVLQARGHLRSAAAAL
jgi:hypothetical protein